MTKNSGSVILNKAIGFELMMIAVTETVIIFYKLDRIQS